MHHLQINEAPTDNLNQTSKGQSERRARILNTYQLPRPRTLRCRFHKLASEIFSTGLVEGSILFQVLEQRLKLRNLGQFFTFCRYGIPGLTQLPGSPRYFTGGCRSVSRQLRLTSVWSFGSFSQTNHIVKCITSRLLDNRKEPLLSLGRLLGFSSSLRRRLNINNEIPYHLSDFSLQSRDNLRKPLWGRSNDQTIIGRKGRTIISFAKRLSGKDTLAIPWYRLWIHWMSRTLLCSITDSQLTSTVGANNRTSGTSSVFCTFTGASLSAR